MTFHDVASFASELEHVNARIYIAGAGLFGRTVGHYLDAHGIAWEGFFDKQKFENKVCNKDVYPYDRLSELVNRPAVFLVSSVSYKEGISETLRSFNISDERIYSFYSEAVLLDMMREMEDISELEDRLLALKDVHHGKACFVVGNGPSLAIPDLERIKEEVSFGCNSIYALFDHTDWRPTYYFANDSIATDNLVSDNLIGSLCNNFQGMFFSLAQHEKFKEIANSENCYFYKLISATTEEERQMCLKNQKSVFWGGTVVCSMIQMAIYMGFSRIYLLGLDCTFPVEMHDGGIVVQNEMEMIHNPLIEAVDRKGYDKAQKRYGYAYFMEYDTMLRGYRSIRKYADGHGIHIYNATRGGKLEVFDRVDFDSLFTDGKFTPERAVIHPREPWYTNSGN